MAWARYVLVKISILYEYRDIVGYCLGEIKDNQVLTVGRQTTLLTGS
jgi:hypothetical protein